MAGQDRRAWAFVIERDGALEIEDLHVRPEFRRKGYGRVLAIKVAELARAKGQALRLWVPFVDCKREAPANYPGLVAIARLLGLRFRPCPVIWAAYFATNEGPGHPEPIEPSYIPARPKSALETVLAAAALLTGAANLAKEPDSDTPLLLTASAADNLPAVNTPEWDAMNERRAELIRKDLDEGLSATEREEYERLQRISLAAAARAFPHPRPDFEGLARLRDELRSAQPGVE
jgi:hypothetical protein